MALFGVGTGLGMPQIGGCCRMQQMLQTVLGLLMGLLTGGLLSRLMQPSQAHAAPNLNPHFGAPNFGANQIPGQMGRQATDFLGSSTAPPANNPGAGSNPTSASGFRSPLNGKFRISSGFGPRRAPTAGASTYHKGVDLAAPTGTPVQAAKGGVVTISTHQMSGGRSVGYGNWIEIKHDDGTKTRYGHLNARNVSPGTRVEAGQVIGTVGNTGTSTGAHLHFEVRNAQGNAIDPQKVMSF